MYEPPRRRAGRRSFVGGVLALLLVGTAVVVAGHLPGGHASTPMPSSAPVEHLAQRPGQPVREHDRQRSASPHGWPPIGQAAYVLGHGRPEASPGEHPVPIASLAKVMTAYLVLEHHTLDETVSGPSFVVDDSDVADTDARHRQGQSTVALQAGERLTERDALMAILLPSANNVAVLVARQISGSVAGFVAEMNATARSLGMEHTIYTDPSGYDPGTVSTAGDQLRLARVVADDPTLATMMATPSYVIPVAGLVTNTDTLLGQDGFVGMKTGSDRAAGGCFMFRSNRHTRSGDVPLIGVVLGQRGPDLIRAGLDAARDLADRVMQEST